jgi:hypothetical protein
LDHSCKTGWNKHDSSYYSKQSSKFYHGLKVLKKRGIYWICILKQWFSCSITI